MSQDFRLKWFIAIVVWTLPMAAGQAAINIDTVPVGNPGNAGEQSRLAHGDTTYYGGVSYAYNIGKYEVTAGQYTEFLNAVAAMDTYGLYHVAMWSDAFGCKIQGTGSLGSYEYNVATDWADRPVNYVSWYDAARFANWLTTGDTESGVYTFSSGLLQSTMDHQTAGTTYGMAYFLPTENEWYKVAYHQNDGDTGNYFAYPTSNNSTPSNDLDGGGNNATFYDSDHTIGDPYWRTEVGAHENSASPYGTFDQGGNVFEWTESAGFRGGAASGHEDWLRAEHRQSGTRMWHYWDVGFRVASIGSAAPVPEPGTVLVWAGLGLIGFSFASMRRYRRRKA